jgi:nucleoid-associated protein YgaU
MYFTKKLRLITITLSLFLAFSAFFLLQPTFVSAGAVKPAKLSTAGNQARIQPSFSNQSTTIGTITGLLSFPSERIPPLTIFAIRIDNGLSTYYSIETTEHQSSYTIEVDPGVYNVFAYRDDFAGGYTKYVTCGMGASCSKHSLLPVKVKSGKTVKNIDLADWYAPAGTFPSRPDGANISPAKPVCVTYHTIRWGETLYKIGMQYNLTWKPIAQVNNILNPNRIFAGQVLCIPSTTRSSTETLPRSSVVPTFVITDVTRNKQVSITTRNFPPFQRFKVTMGKMYTRGIDGIPVDESYSGSGGSFNATYTIPGKLRGLDRIAIRLETSSGYYSYNWFYNKTTH